MEKMKVVGKQHLDFVGKDGNRVVGVKLHCFCKKNDVEGEATESIFINARSESYDTAKAVSVGSYVDVSFNRWGKADSVQACK